MFNLFLYQPLYNALVFLSNVLPSNDFGLAIIVLTLIVKFALLPLYKKSTLTQLKMKELEPELAKIKEIKDKQEQTRQMLDIYKKNNVNPFVTFLILLIQFPIVIALYSVFSHSGVADPAMLYSFVTAPTVLHTVFLGLVELTKPSIVLALLTGITQFLQMKILLPATPPKSEKPSMKEDFARSMNIQMKYFMPIVIILVSSRLSAAISLYWVASNIFSIFQELYFKKKYKTKKAAF